MMNLFDHFAIIITEDLNEKLLSNRKKMPNIIETLLKIKINIESSKLTEKEKIEEYKFCKDKMLE